MLELWGDNYFHLSEAPSSIDLQLVLYFEAGYDFKWKFISETLKNAELSNNKAFSGYEWYNGFAGCKIPYQKCFYW